MKLLIIRHGQTDGNVKGLVQGAGLDLPLNETGRARRCRRGETAFPAFTRHLQFDHASCPADGGNYRRRRRLPDGCRRRGWKKCISAKRKACFRKTLTGFTATCSR